jgi:ribosomal protein S18 acetylase RimI-like enzyme
MFEISGLTVIRIHRDDAARIGELQQLLERCSDCYELLEEAPTPASAATDEFDLIPPEFPRDDIFILGFGDDAGLVAEMSLVRGCPNPDEWWMALFVVDPEHRGRGIGRRICDATFRWIASGTMVLAVDEANPRAERFWRSLGFAETGRRDYTAPTESKRRVIVMRRPLP